MHAHSYLQKIFDMFEIDREQYDEFECEAPRHALFPQILPRCPGDPSESH
jgi:hypothetical protein